MYAWNASWVIGEKKRVVALTGPGIRVEPKVLLVEEERVVPRQLPRPHALVMVGCVRFMVKCSFYLQKKKQMFKFGYMRYNTRIQPLSTGFVKTEGRFENRWL